MMESNKMDRGTDALKTHLADREKIHIRQTKRGWFQECLGCEAKNEFKYFKEEGETEMFAHSLDEADFCCRLCCAPIYPYKTPVKETTTEAELYTVDRPFVFCAAGPCKCCCYQEMTVTSGSETMGTVKEDCYYCVPSFTASDENGQPYWVFRPPTCLGGLCVNCCAEGNPCTKQGCCRASFRVYPVTQQDRNGDAPYIGQILIKPKSFSTAVLTDANAFDVTFPEGSSTSQKATMMGATTFFNSIFFESNEQN